jgi:hypothetical protein
MAALIEEKKVGSTRGWFATGTRGAISRYLAIVAAFRSVHVGKTLGGILKGEHDVSP